MGLSNILPKRMISYLDVRSQLADDSCDEIPVVAGRRGSDGLLTNDALNDRLNGLNDLTDGAALRGTYKITFNNELFQKTLLCLDTYDHDILRNMPLRLFNRINFNLDRNVLSFSL
jgi:hypothetical protein